MGLQPTGENFHCDEELHSSSVEQLWVQYLSVELEESREQKRPQGHAEESVQEM
jgi:hypothetical protein